MERISLFFKIRKKGRKTPKLYKIENISAKSEKFYRDYIKKKGAFDIGKVKVK